MSVPSEHRCRDCGTDISKLRWTYDGRCDDCQDKETQREIEQQRFWDQEEMPFEVVVTEVDEEPVVQHTGTCHSFADAMLQAAAWARDWPPAYTLSIAVRLPGPDEEA